MGSYLIKGIYRTLKKNIYGNADFTNHILALYHQQFFTFSGYFNREIKDKEELKQYTILVSTHRDGEILASIIKKLGARVIRGDSRREPITALKRMVRLLKEKSTLIIAVDGPLGPYKKIQTGIIYAALSSGRPVNMFINFSSRKWIFKKAWDRFYIPSPGARSLLYFTQDWYADKKRSVEENLEDFKGFIQSEQKEARRLYREFLIK
ncbi:lysophospholipid acyltransferase family protein [Spirochaetota bacterium]